MWELKEIAGKSCHILHEGDGGPVFLWPFYPHEGEELERLENALQKALPDGGYTIAAWQVEDWNRDLSPWAAPIAMGEGQFAGGATSVLGWMTADFLPGLKKWILAERRMWIPENAKGTKYYLMGYSLAGLFALWSLYETDCFDGAVCCSGSLWLDSWDRYVAARSVKAPADVYLSLGGREEKSKNPVMARVGERTREQEKILKQDPQVRRCILEWNPGGHFADSAQRLAKGVRWVYNVRMN